MPEKQPAQPVKKPASHRRRLQTVEDVSRAIAATIRRMERDTLTPTKGRAIVQSLKDLARVLREPTGPGGETGRGGAELAAWLAERVAVSTKDGGGGENHG